MNKQKSALFSAIAVFLMLILASSAFSLPMVAFKPIDPDYNPRLDFKLPTMPDTVIPGPIDPVDDPVEEPLIPRIPRPEFPTELAPVYPVPDDDGDSGDDTPDTPDTPDDPSPIAKPDLAVTSFTADKREVAYGENVKFTFTIKNLGSKTAYFDYAFLPDHEGELVKPRPWPMPLESRLITNPEFVERDGAFVTKVSLAPGESLKKSVVFRYDPEKPHRDIFPQPLRLDRYVDNVVVPRVIADYTRGISESNEDNNMAALKLRLYKPSVTVEQKPDLTIEVSTYNTEFVAGQPVSLEVRMGNIGDKTVLDSSFKINYGDGVIEEYVAPVLLPGDVLIKSLTYVYPEPDTYAIRVMADYDEEIEELDEDNNRDTLFIEVIEEPVVETPLPQCSDEEDNDGDGLVDSDDPGCDSAEDDDEYNEVFLSGTVIVESLSLDDVALGLRETTVTTIGPHTFEIVLIPTRDFSFVNAGLELVGDGVSVGVSENLADVITGERYTMELEMVFPEESVVDETYELLLPIESDHGGGSGVVHYIQIESDEPVVEEEPACYAHVVFTNSQDVLHSLQLGEAAGKILEQSTGAQVHVTEEGDSSVHNIQLGDIFVVSHGDVTRVLSYDDIDTVDNIITLTDIGTGAQINVVYSGLDQPFGVDTIVAGGYGFGFSVSSEAGNPLAVDLNDDGAFGSGSASIVSCRGDTCEILELDLSCAYECNDGEDNDLDGFVDLADSACRYLTHDHETEEVEVPDDPDNPVLESEFYLSNIVIQADSVLYDVTDDAELDLPNTEGQYKLSVDVTYTGDADAEMNDIELWIEFDDQDSTDEYEDTADTFDLGANETETVVFVIDSPALAEGGLFDLIVEATGEDERGIMLNEEVEATVFIEQPVVPDPDPQPDPDPESDLVPVLTVTPLNGTVPLDIGIDASASVGVTAYSLTVTGPGGFVYGELGMPGAPGTWELQLTEVGNYVVQLFVGNDEGDTLSVGETVTVLSADGGDDSGDDNGDDTGDDTGDDGNQTTDNLPPVPVIVMDPASGDAPLNVTFYANESNDPDGYITAYSWTVYNDEGDAHVNAKESLTGEVEFEPYSVVLDKNTTYNVLLSVTDNNETVMTAETNLTLGPEGSGDDSGDNGGDDSGDDSSDESEAPSISNRRVKDITSDSVTIKWRTDIDADSEVLYGTDDDDLDEDEYDNDLEEVHEIELEDLEPYTKYYYTIISCSEDNKCTEKGPYHFTTLSGGSSSGGSSDDDYYDDWDDYYAQNAALFDSPASNSASSPETAPVVTTAQDETGDVVEVIYAPTQYIEVEDEVCKFRFLWWCVWKDVITKKIPLPALTGGVEFVL
jgi:hypothetical protein